MNSSRRIAFVTIGHSPRSDIVPEMVAEILGERSQSALEVQEFGVLDGLGVAELEQMKATQSEAVFATRDAAGSEISVSVQKTETRLNALLNRIDDLDFDLIVLLCTGTCIDPLAKTLVVEAQRVIDSTITALAAINGPLGILVPYASQTTSLFSMHDLTKNARFAAASPYDGSPLATRVTPLAACPVTIMHCMGYSREMRDEVNAAIPGHVLHGRGLVAGLVRQLI